VRRFSRRQNSRRSLTKGKVVNTAKKERFYVEKIDEIET